MKSCVLRSQLLLLSHSANMFTAVSYSVLLRGFIMWKELITSVETDPRHVKVTLHVFFLSPADLTVSLYVGGYIINIFKNI